MLTNYNCELTNRVVVQKVLLLKLMALLNAPKALIFKLVTVSQIQIWCDYQTAAAHWLLVFELKAVLRPIILEIMSST